MTASTARGGRDLAPLAPSQSDTLELALRLSILVVGAFAMRAMWQSRAHARRLTGLWATLVLSLVVAQDVAADFFRTDLPDRLLATGLITVIVCTAAWRARPQAPRAPDRTAR